MVRFQPHRGLEVGLINLSPPTLPLGALGGGITSTLEPWFQGKYPMVSWSQKEIFEDDRTMGERCGFREHCSLKQPIWNDLDWNIYADQSIY